ncbi:N-acetylmuramoyl-L-alanine amidase [Antarcticibacterium sp. 1MA-6-2]|uniref:N-acetylmuramoyl-L-alanine amidase family protein n=1 Tax=Antarcticibacterium sp. 1MA-6-2 TaxID=2908210 RepID=UPI001F31C17F|nr:N-acetylmuramoyl-L-alanine amidase [Antarcticibacterium sp. 1MA-6-2]UJH91923.1 N-acetylmuramoyl-L-alanine amidase [Antarcticibacterium sp. 1MA-6-2]
MWVIFGQEKEHQKRIIVDVGHGGKDPGAIGINGIREKDVVLAIGTEMIRLNKSIFGDEYDIYLTRYDDGFFTLSERINLAKSLRGDVFISLHCNSFYSDARGMEIFTFNSESRKNGYNTRTSIALGDEILRESTLNINIENRGMKFANFQVLRGMIKFCPAILIEVGFLNNPVEAVHYSRPSGIRAIALAILSGINNHLKLK